MYAKTAPSLLSVLANSRAVFDTSFGERLALDGKVYFVLTGQCLAARNLQTCNPITSLSYVKANDHVMFVNNNNSRSVVHTFKPSVGAELSSNLYDRYREIEM
jgi:hypothetical protein